MWSSFMPFGGESSNIGRDLGILWQSPVTFVIRFVGAEVLTPQLLSPL